MAVKVVDLPQGYYPAFIYDQWHATLNGIRTPFNTSRGSHTMITWNCDHGHHYPSRITERLRGKGCPFCAGRKVWRGDNDFETRHPVPAAEWHPYLNGPTFPWQYTHKSREGKIWVCPEGHVYYARIDHRANGSGCAKCEGQVVDPGRTDMATTNPWMALEWHPTKNGSRTPQNTMAGSRFRAVWNCPNGHDPYPMMCFDHLSGKGCPECVRVVSVAETELAEFVKTLGHKTYTSNRGLLGKYEVDIYLPDDRFAIEFNGLYWHSDANGKPTDYHHFKWETLHRKGIHLLQVWEDDWTTRRPVVEQAIHDILAAGKPLPATAAVQPVSSDTATAFLAAHSLAPVGAASTHYAVKVKDEIVAICGVNAVQDGSVSITGFAAAYGAVDALRLLETYLHAQGHDSMRIVADHTRDDGAVFAAAGFTVVDELKPAYTYYHQRRRMPQDEYEAIVESGYPAPRVWDAGQTIFIKALQQKL